MPPCFWPFGSDLHESANHSACFLAASTTQDIVSNVNLCPSDRQKAIISCCLHAPFPAYTEITVTQGCAGHLCKAERPELLRSEISQARVWWGETKACQAVHTARAKALRREGAWQINRTEKLMGGQRAEGKDASEEEAGSNLAGPWGSSQGVWSSSQEKRKPMESDEIRSAFWTDPSGCCVENRLGRGEVEGKRTWCSYFGSPGERWWQARRGWTLDWGGGWTWREVGGLKSYWGQRIDRNWCLNGLGWGVWERVVTWKASGSVGQTGWELSLGWRDVEAAGDDQPENWRFRGSNCFGEQPLRPQHPLRPADHVALPPGPQPSGLGEHLRRGPGTVCLSVRGQCQTGLWASFRESEGKPKWVAMFGTGGHQKGRTTGRKRKSEGRRREEKGWVRRSGWRPTVLGPWPCVWPRGKSQAFKGSRSRGWFPSSYVDELGNLEQVTQRLWGCVLFSQL